MDSPQMDLRTIIEEACKSSAPPLKTLCFIRCAIELYIPEKVRDLLKCLKYYKDVLRQREMKSQKAWKEINKIIVNKLNSLVIPKKLKDRVLSYSFSIALEIAKWIHAYPSLSLPEEFCWTVKGTIDYKRTVKMILENESMCILKRYILSCRYCLENDIFLLWRKMSIMQKNYIIDNVPYPLVSLWAKTCAPNSRRILQNRDQLFREAFKDIVKQGYIDAAKYFLYEMRSMARQTFLDEIFVSILDNDEEEQEQGVEYDEKYMNFMIPHANEVDIWFFLFANMEEVHQLKYFLDVEWVQIVFNMFLCSSRQKYLVMLMNLARTTLDRRHYNDIGFILLYKYQLGFKDCNYRKTFIQFWHAMPNSDRKFLQRKKRLGINLLVHLISKHFPFLMKRGTMKSKGELISKYLNSNKLISRCHFDRDNWKFLLFIIEEHVVTWNVIKLNKQHFLDSLGIRKEKDLAWKKTSILIRRILAKKKWKLHSSHNRSLSSFKCI